MTARKPLILVADDDPGARLLLQAAFEGGGFDVVTAADGATALGLFAAHRPDCVVSDVVMPGLNGYELCQTIRRHPLGQHTPILILTSLDDIESINLAYGAGATDFGVKGIAPSLLVQRVRFLLRSGELQLGLLESEARLAEAQRIARIGHWEMDATGSTISISPMALELLDLDGARATSIRALLLRTHEDDRARLEDAARVTLSSTEVFGLDLRIVARDGHMRHVHLEGQWSDRTGGAHARTFVLTLQDLTPLRSAEDRLRQLASFDPATGLPNMATLRDRLAQAMVDARANQQQIALFALDVEQFNRYNHTIGIEAANELLVEIGQRLNQTLVELRSRGQRSIGAAAMTARIGGDEFALMLPLQQGITQVADALQAVQTAMRAPFKVREHELTTSVTIGVAVFPDDGEDAPTLVRMADAAVHQAKRATRGGHQFYSATLQDRAAERLALESELRRALEREQFEIWYQPRVSVDTLAPVGCEALLRWRHPERGLVSPAQFIPIAEELGLIVEIGQWVLSEACRTTAARLRDGLSLPVSVNVSAVQFQRASVSDQVAAALRAHNLSAELLTLEVTEGVLIDRPQLVREALAAVKAQGVRIALDDFGAGYSSLSYLRRLPIDDLKIDRSFIRDLDEGDGAIVTAILTLARGLGLRTVAEGVETLPQFDFLAARGCDEIQGFLFAKPMPDAEMRAWLRKWLGTMPRREDFVSCSASTGTMPMRVSG